jgi:hypothetical protein
MIVAAPMSSMGHMWFEEICSCPDLPSALAPLEQACLNAKLRTSSQLESASSIHYQLLRASLSSRLRCTGGCNEVNDQNEQL